MSIRLYSLQSQKWLLQPLHSHIHWRDVTLKFLILHAVNNNKKKLLSDLIATDNFSEPHLPLSWKVFCIALWLGYSTSEYNDVYNYCILITHYILKAQIQPVIHYVFMQRTQRKRIIFVWLSKQKQHINLCHALCLSHPPIPWFIHRLQLSSLNGANEILSHQIKS